MHHEPIPADPVQPHIPPRRSAVLPVSPPADQLHHPIIEHTYDQHKHAGGPPAGVSPTRKEQP